MSDIQLMLKGIRDVSDKHVLITFDAGSTHMGKRPFCKELIDIAVDVGADVIKFQLFKGEAYTKSGNIELNRDWFGDLFRYARSKQIYLTASVFDKEACDLVVRFDVPYIKFAYSQQESPLIKGLCSIGKKVIVSSDVMRRRKLDEYGPNCLRLFCVTNNGVPLYPVNQMVNFEGLFGEDGRGFHGYSDHSLGSASAKAAVRYGARYIEKHLTLPYNDVTCPDAEFALRPKEAAQFVKDIRRIQEEL